MTDPTGGANSLSQATAQQILQALGAIAKACSTSALPTATIASSAGSATGTYLQINVGGTVYKLQLLAA